MAIVNLYLRNLSCCSSRLNSMPSFLYFPRNFSLWSMKKDPDLELALSRNRRWIVNNQIKNIILRYPNQVTTVKNLQKKFKTLDLQGKALNWLRKYPCCFEVYLENDEYYCRLTKRMMSLVEEEECVKGMQEPIFVDRLVKLLMMSWNQRLNVVKLNELKRNFGFPDDYIIRILPKYTDTFRLVNYTGRKSSMEIELVSWKPELAVSAVEASAQKQSSESSFSCCLPSTWVTSRERFLEFNSTPYISPYSDPRGLQEGSKEMEKRIVGLVHELLSLTLWKKMSIVKLGHFKREFGLPEKLNVLLLKHPGIFYVSNKYQIYTVLLREAYNGPELVEKDPLVLVKDKFGELMQEGLHEYNRRHHLVNLEKKRKRGMVPVRSEEMKNAKSEISEQDDSGDKLGGLFDPEERKRFYKVLFDDGPP
ncbi:protein WHAT'S THIS FACTOR 1 homolog, chloroplastic-like [Pistacia vera]|uniref:protein WHAT'S THIS FACTOR 1 homolog, chloroplastic-like n=1 Tax=Pistacia vera TaxID=55513 RepID=UPI0012638865|nr:protein WHAT'S THIS FACTOR 1 homolog, chloroplastic-like [Pistacia vera]XP_031251809.1 protein WHAT'S THIS FACTOR 1 homolog, chloroplastic-like [Pistacia vera]XP_031251820.1 protein WHAT'S THIS FACTOR 1 homolog, chloroplastic-like [Pistacia vera]XP_031251827.1 protein WHAT'S THIS FACTOR 1 homolog, chloroplastic-like [Pistacia vera]XP_031251830.1 protein WHAT'S THIS FACTOR 1 homolog, chloroplastic-like [Pistacia vera]XP_031251835.1 protein WHAT'S THIS FACTOR 1 homolog, chloroplastic-like [Pi